MRVTTFAGLILASLASFAVETSVSAEELVRFDSAAYGVGKLQQRLAQERGETLTAGPTTRIEGYLSKPDGAGPFPAVVFLHGCTGLATNARDAIAERMTSWGYVALSVDSFATRGINQACGIQEIPNRQADALGALLYLSRQAFVDPRRIAVLGASQGGIAALQLASTRPAGLFVIPDELKFKAAVAYYPLCSLASDQASIPTLVMIGELDDWAPVADCERWMKRRAGAGAPVKLVTYPGAYHLFDVPLLRDGRRFLGHWLKYDPDAGPRSLAELHDFLAAELSR
jgi:dienelactone hydrolase